MDHGRRTSATFAVSKIRLTILVNFSENGGCDENRKIVTASIASGESTIKLHMLTIGSGKRNMAEAKPLSSQFRRQIQMTIESLSCAFAGIATFMLVPASRLFAERALVGMVVAAGCFLALFQLKFPEFFRQAINGDDVSVHPDQQEHAPPRTFKVPRRFGIRSIVFLTMVFALLSSALQSIGLATDVSLLILGFVGLVAFGQVFLNHVPRRVSAVIGIAAAFTLSALGRGRFGPLECLLGGAFAGYAVGAALGALFLFAGAVEHWWCNTGSVVMAAQSVSE